MSIWLVKIWDKVLNKGLDDKDDKKEGVLKRLKNIEKNQSINNNDKNKKNKVDCELKSIKSESSKETSIRDDELEWSVYSPDVANIEGVDILGWKGETQNSYLKDDLEVFFLGYPEILDLDLKIFLKILCLKKKKILITS